MKRVLTLISTVGIFTIFTTGILVSGPKSASAFCVKNLTGAYISGEDTHYEQFSPKWSEQLLPPDWKACCPSWERGCNEGANLKIDDAGDHSKGSGSCDVWVSARGLVEVRYHNYEMVCNVINP